MAGIVTAVAYEEWLDEQFDPEARCAVCGEPDGLVWRDGRFVCRDARCHETDEAATP